MNKQELKDTPASAGVSVKRPPRSWYSNYYFPLIPIIETRKKDYYNTYYFSFHWLFLKLWTLDTAIKLEFAFVFSGHWGVGFIAILPFLRVVLTVPFPFWINCYLSKMDRKCDHLKEIEINENE